MPRPVAVATLWAWYAPTDRRAPARALALTGGYQAGYFVNFHAYPYYPDFLKYPLVKYNVSYAEADNIDIVDPYFLCLTQLHVRDMAPMIDVVGCTRPTTCMTHPLAPPPPLF